MLTYSFFIMLTCLTRVDEVLQATTDAFNITWSLQYLWGENVPSLIKFPGVISKSKKVQTYNKHWNVHKSYYFEGKHASSPR